MDINYAALVKRAVKVMGKLVMGRAWSKMAPKSQISFVDDPQCVIKMKFLAILIAL